MPKEYWYFYSNAVNVFTPDPVADNTPIIGIRGLKPIAFHQDAGTGLCDPRHIIPETDLRIHPKTAQLRPHKLSNLPLLL